jgi:hypothetical protein
MASTEIALYIYNLIIIIVSPDIHGYVYYMVFANYFKKCILTIVFRTFPYGNTIYHVQDHIMSIVNLTSYQ